MGNFQTDENNLCIKNDQQNPSTCYHNTHKPYLEYHKLIL